MVTLDVDHDGELLDAPGVSEPGSPATPSRADHSRADHSRDARTLTSRHQAGDRPLADLPVLRSISRRFAIGAAQLILLGIMILAIARLFWTLFAPLPYPEVAPTIVSAQRDQPSIADRISARNPFAMTGAPVSDVVIEPSDELQETQLDLVLHGVSVYGEKSSAIIDVKNGDGQNSFPIGAAIVNGVTLKEVYFDEVVIERNGIREVLRMRDADKQNSPSTRSRLRSSSLNGNARSANSIRNRSGAAATPDNNNELDTSDAVASSSDEPVEIKLRDLVNFRVRQGKDGNPALYLYPGRNRSAFADTGLQSQDILVSINGAPVPQDLRRAYQTAEQAMEAGSINLVIERDGIPKSITIDIQELLTVQNPEALTLPTGDEVEL